MNCVVCGAPVTDLDTSPRTFGLPLYRIALNDPLYPKSMGSREGFCGAACAMKWFSARGRGLEPRLPDPKSGVLPLDDPR